MQIINTEQGSQEWLEARQGVITGTKLKSIMGGPKAQETAIYDIIGNEFSDLEAQNSSNAMQRGNDLEEIAKQEYIEKTGEDVQEVGMIKTNDYLGLSPDGLIEKDGKFKKAIEIKCPLATNFVKYVLQNKCPDDYKWQVVMYFLVIDDLEELDFIVYNPSFNIKEKQLHIINIKREVMEKDIEKARERIVEFRENWLENINQLLGNQ